MNFEAFIAGIGIEKEATKGLNKLDTNELQPLFSKDKELFFRSVLDYSQRIGADFRKVFLKIYIDLALAAFTEYEKRDIGKEIYFDTFSDIAVWASNCKRDFGVWGIDEYKWLPLHCELKIFKLGRLQFEPMIFERDISPFKKGQSVLNVHIQQGQPLLYEECQKSYNWAYEFFEKKYDTFVCHSWLLNPCLKEILPQNANIIKFQSDYTVFEIDESDRQCEERVFIKKCDNPSDYPRETSLQQKIAEYLKRGKKIGIAFGYLKINRGVHCASGKYGRKL